MVKEVFPSPFSNSSDSDTWATERKFGKPVAKNIKSVNLVSEKHGVSFLGKKTK